MLGGSREIPIYCDATSLVRRRSLETEAVFEGEYRTFPVSVQSTNECWGVPRSHQVLRVFAGRTPTSG